MNEWTNESAGRPTAANWRQEMRDAVAAVVVVVDDDDELGWSACHTSRHFALLCLLVYDCACAKLSLPPPAVSVWFTATRPASTSVHVSRYICMRLSAVRLLECQLWRMHCFSPLKWRPLCDTNYWAVGCHDNSSSSSSRVMIKWSCFIVYYYYM